MSPYQIDVKWENVDFCFMSLWLTKLTCQEDKRKEEFSDSRLSSLPLPALLLLLSVLTLSVKQRAWKSPEEKLWPVWNVDQVWAGLLHGEKTDCQQAMYKFCFAEVI